MGYKFKKKNEPMQPPEWFQQGKRVIIPEGVGYTDYTSGLVRFDRAASDFGGTMTNYGPSGQVYIKTDDGKTIITRYGLIKEEK